MTRTLFYSSTASLGTNQSKSTSSDNKRREKSVKVSTGIGEQSEDCKFFTTRDLTEREHKEPDKDDS